MNKRTKKPPPLIVILQPDFLEGAGGGDDRIPLTYNFRHPGHRATPPRRSNPTMET